MSSLTVPGTPVPSDQARGELDRWREYVEDRSGLAFTGVRARVLAEAVAARIAARGHPSVASYFRYLTTPDGDAEWRQLLNYLLNRDTRFYRDPPALAALTRRALPALRERRHREGVDRITLWSAGCSTGQEAYSIAMACLADPNRGDWRIEVLGSDICHTALVQAETGVYGASAIADVPEGIRRRYFIPLEDRPDAGVRVSPTVRAVVRFESCDLLAGAWPVARDVIFCQNVLIYYRLDRRNELLRRLIASLAPGGFLFLGAAEALGLPTPGLELLRLEDTWLYCRVG